MWQVKIDLQYATYIFFEEKLKNDFHFLKNRKIKDKQKNRYL